ncbi:glucosamine-6-phosphate deaminase [Rhizobium leguminosarum]|uniref:glucosamine-6-phosphate deaminase n=1 Tax=Rhizobium leguminosarum TaxID=384 RepID=UPI003F9E2E7E
MKIVICESVDEAAHAAAEVIIAQVAKNSASRLGLATGSTVEPIYKEVVNLGRLRNISFRAVTTFNLDEYVSVAKEDSYRATMEKLLFSHLDFVSKNTNIPNGASHNLLEEAGRYERLIQAGGIDLQLLGIGRNGHIGFNEPGTPFERSTHVAKLAKATREANTKFFGHSSVMPREAITIGLKTIMSALEIVVVAFGSEKASIVAQAFEGQVVEDVPASVLQRHPRVTVILDRSAAGELQHISRSVSFRA